MQAKKTTNQLVIVGKINDVCSCLKYFEKKYIYVKDLIEALKSDNKTKCLN